MMKRNVISTFLILLALFGIFLVLADSANTPLSYNAILNISRNVGKLGANGLLDVNGVNKINISGTFNLSVSILKNGTHNENITNVSFAWIDAVTGAVAANFSVNRSVANQSEFSFSFATTSLANGRYNLTIMLINLTDMAGDPITNTTVALNITVDNSGPGIITLMMNTSIPANLINGVNLTRGQVDFNLSVNDSLLRVDVVKFGIRHEQNDSEFNLTGNLLDVAGRSVWNYTLDLARLTDGLYNVTGYVNDTLGNLNSTKNISFIVDNTPPQVNLTDNYKAFFNYRNYTESNGANQSFNISIRDVSFVQVRYWFDNATGKDFNFTPTNRSGNWSTANGFGGATNTGSNFSELVEGVHTITILANDTMGWKNETESFTFIVDKTLPNVTVGAMNYTTYTNYLLNFTRGVIQFNVTANDSFTTITNVWLSFTNVNNGTQVNVSLTNYTVKASSLGIWTVNSLLSTFADGQYNITVYANDTIGHVNGSINNISFTVDNTPPDITFFGMNFTNNTVFLKTKAIAFDLNATDNYMRVTSVIFGFTSDRNASQFNVTASHFGETLWTINLTLLPLIDGNYTVTSYVSDYLGNRNGAGQLISNLSFMVDGNGPNVTGLLMWNISSSDFNVSLDLSYQNITLNATVNDTTTRVSAVKFGVSNGSNEVNYTASAFGGKYNVTISLESFAEGGHNVTVYANDTMNNLNNTALNNTHGAARKLNFIIDRSSPTVTVTCSPSAATVGQTVTCTCTAGDSYSGVYSKSYTTESTSAGAIGSFTSTTCWAQDYAGNVGSGYATWTVSAAASTGGSGATGSSGGTSSGSSGMYEQKTWTSIYVGETASLTTKNGELGVTTISFGVDKTAWGAWLKVQKLDTLASSLADAFKGDVYAYLEITKGVALPNDIIKNPKIEFKVAKAWLKEKKLDKKDVALFRYVEDKWTQLKTTVGEDDGTYIHYTAETPGFSYFIIGKAQTAVEEAKPVSEEAAEKPVAAAEVPTEAAGEVVTIEKEKAPAAVWPWIVITAIVVLAVIVWYFTKKKKKR